MSPGNTQPIARVAITGPFEQGLDYLLPMKFAQQNIVGCRVRVPLGRQQRIGLVISLPSDSNMPVNKLKQILELIDGKPILPPHLMILLRWMQGYYHAAPMALFQLALPRQLLQGKPLEAKQPRYYQLTVSGAEQLVKGNKRAPKQIEALMLLKQRPLLQQVLKQRGISTATINALLNKGWITVVQPTDSDASPCQEDLLGQIALNADQKHAVDTILHVKNQFAPFVLYGVTGSGKTEVYLRLMQTVLAQGKQVLMLVPEIGLTPQTESRLAKRLPVPLYRLHSALTETDKRDQWARASQNQPCVVIGTRSALFAPLPNLGLIIVDEEHDLSFKQQNGIRYHARDVAVRLAQICQVPVVLGSATPSLESWHNAERDRYQLLTLHARAGGASMPICHIINMNQQNIQAGLSQPLLAEIDRHVSQDGQVLLFLNRRGFAPVLLCLGCGWHAHCERCDAKMTIHRHKAILMCHRCGHSKPLISQCPQCQSTMPLQQIGVGTEKLETTLRQLFADKCIVRVDRDQAHKKDQLEKRLQQIHQGEADIIIGTQMLAKGHHFEKVTMVAVVDIDSALFSQDFRSLEHLGQLLMQVAGRAGRETKQGEVYLQTLQPQHWALQLLLKSGYTDFAKQLLTERQAAHWPPYRYLAAFIIECQQQSKACQALEQLVNQVQSHLVGEVDIFGPVPALQPKRAGYYRWQILLQAQDRSILHQHISTMQLAMRQLDKTLRWYLDVDPVGL